jgi:hypothetical protein
VVVVSNDLGNDGGSRRRITAGDNVGDDAGRKELRQLDRGFYGIGLPHPGVECFVAQINKLLVHYGCSSGLGIHMQVSMEMMVIEEGISS